ncbi:hypothetical protein [Bradyrhizobium sp.]|uniref:hypothetical protein n=1 Tax=Bradyrhizobium sp. TaxID=376 RepID=UPI00239B0DC5|nr:hypothetical protein [Bradyrhizobium sp.]MDE2377323.1 hypothetical protein [Bradyrhizobium sp.]
MPVLRECAIVAAALFALLVVSDAMFGEDAGRGRFDAALYDSTTYAPRSDDSLRNASPAVRVREVFAQFLPGEGQRGKRYSSLTTFIR